MKVVNVHQRLLHLVHAVARGAEPEPDDATRRRRGVAAAGGRSLHEGGIGRGVHLTGDRQALGLLERANSALRGQPEDSVGATVDGRTLTLKYKDGQKKIFVPADTPIVLYELGDRADLKPGAKVFIVAVKQPDGTLEGRAWRVGRNGAAPAF